MKDWYQRECTHKHTHRFQPDDEDLTEQPSSVRQYSRLLRVDFFVQ